MTAAKSARALVLALLLLCAALAAGGCGTSSPRPLTAAELAEAQTFPYFRVYWVGPSFDGYRLVAADGLGDYVPTVGDSVYYGDCVQGEGIFGGGNCELPLQVTTVVYALHSNAGLGVQRNTLVRGVPAAVYDEGRAIELYTGRLAIDIFSDSFAHALQAADELRPMNAPGSAAGDLPLPVYCPGLSGKVDAQVQQAMESLPGHICRYTRAEKAYIKAVDKRS
jgi:hypothetical protein